MKKIEHLCIIAPSYPTDENPVTPFIDQLICEFANQGINCNVIVPSGLVGRLINKTARPPRQRTRVTGQNKLIHIFHPPHAGGLPIKILGVNVSKLSYKIFKRCVMKEFERINIRADAVYGHFIYPSGLCAAEIGGVYNIPSFLAYGESSPGNYMHLDQRFLCHILSNLDGIIAVSSHNKNEILETGILPPHMENRVSVFPNGIDTRKFHVMDKSEARRHLDIEDEKFIVAFVGHYIERKGINILAGALDRFNDVYSFFIGKGSWEPKCKNILYQGPVSHDKLYLYLNAADVFVLPTLAEGCCNAIIEALACGLPVVSSDLPFNDDILDDKCSIRVNPRDQNDIYEAVITLKNNKVLRDKMSIAAVQKAKELDISKRAKNIIAFMEQRINER